MLLKGKARRSGALILDQLRSATRKAHGALEDALALLDPPLQRERFVHALAGFRNFHRAWEPRIEALVADPDLLAPRRKLALLDRDLTALGEARRAPPHHAFDLDFLQTSESAWGSLYVLEGATLGGQVISTALRGADWLPGGGLTYFNPYETRTGFMWRQFRTALEAQTLDVEATTAGACATFATLQAGFTQAEDVTA